MQKEKLETVQSAIRIESERLKDLYDIQENAKTLEVLILAQKQKKELFEVEMQEKKQALDSEMSEKKHAWEKEKLVYENAQKEQEQALKQKRKREEEEYQYQMAIKVKKDADEYEAKKISLERDLGEKHNQAHLDISKKYEDLKKQDDDLKSLRDAQKNYEHEIQTVRITVKEQTQKDLDLKYKFESELKDKDHEGKISLLTQEIRSLKDKLSEKEKTIEFLHTQVSTAQLQSQDLAKKVVEGGASHLKTSFLPQQSEDKDKKPS